MTWPLSGNFSGAQIGPDVRSILESLCWAVNEREAFVTGTQKVISSITRSGSTATATTTASHGIPSGNVERVFVWGANQSEYNGVKTVTSTGTNTFTFAVSGTPATPATTATSINCRTALTSFMYDSSGNKKRFPTASDFVDFPVHRVVPAARPVASISQSLGVMTVRCPGHGFVLGDWIVIEGANESGYNGEFEISDIPDAVNVASLSRSGSTVTVDTTGNHGLQTGDMVLIVGATPSNYNGIWTVSTAPTATRFTFGITGSPASPATGTITAQDCSRFSYTSGSLSPSATGTLTVKGRRNPIYSATWADGTGKIYCLSHGFSVGDWVQIEHETDSAWRLSVRVYTVSTDSFSFSYANSLSNKNWDSTARFWCSKPIGLRPVLHELQRAVESLLTASTSAGVVRFVEGSGTYETNYTLANLLRAGSFGSSWLSLINRNREDCGFVMEQIRQALDLLVYTTVNDTATQESHTEADSYFSYLGQWRINENKVWLSWTVSQSGTTVTVTCSEQHLLSAGDEVLIYLITDTGPNFWDKVTVDSVVNSTTFKITVTDTLDPDERQPDLLYPLTKLENAWDNAVGASPRNTASKIDFISLRLAEQHHETIGLKTTVLPLTKVWTQDAYACRVQKSASAIFSITSMAGTYVSGEIYLQQSNNGNVTQDTYILSDSDSDTATIDASVGTTDQLLTVSKGASFFGAPSKTLTFTTPAPASNPFSTALGNNETTKRSVKVRIANAAKHTRQLVPGTHLTYG